MTSGSRAVALWALIVVNVIWGFHVAFTALAVQDMSPFAFNAIRTGVALSILLPLGLRAGLWPVVRRGWPGLLLSGIMGFTISQTAFAFSLKLAPGAIIAILSALGPLTLAFMSILFLGERMARAGWMGMALATTGALLILGLSPAELGGEGISTLLGGIIFLGGIISWYAFNVVAKRLLVREEPMAMAAGATLFGWVGLLIAFGIHTAASGEAIQWSSQAIFGILFTGILGNAFGFLALHWALKRLEGSRVGALSYIQPVLGVVGAWTFLGEQPGPSFLLGALLILAGVYLVTTAHIRIVSPPQRPAAAPRPELKPESPT
ncbi:MAG: DMT family transporter [Dehalococcoidia bacterium]